MGWKHIAIAWAFAAVAGWSLSLLGAPGWARILGGWVMFSTCVSLMTLGYLQGIVRTVRASIDEALGGRNGSG